MHQVSEMTLLIMKFRFVQKSWWKSVLCSREISLKRPQIVTQTFARTLLDSYREQRMKFARYACITFAQYCNCTFFDMLQWRVIIKVRLVLLWVFWLDWLSWQNMNHDMARLAWYAAKSYTYQEGMIGTWIRQKGRDLCKTNKLNEEYLDMTDSWPVTTVTPLFILNTTWILFSI